jgi:hypothetical protein
MRGSYPLCGHFARAAPGRTEQRVDPKVFVTQAPQRIVAVDLARGNFPEAARQRRISKQADNLLRESRLITGGYKQAVRLVFHEFGQAAHAESDNGFSHRERLENGQRLSLPEAGENDECAARQCRANDGGRPRIRQHDVFPEPVGAYRLEQLITQAPLFMTRSYRDNESPLSPDPQVLGNPQQGPVVLFRADSGRVQKDWPPVVSAQMPVKQLGLGARRIEVREVCARAHEHRLVGKSTNRSLTYTDERRFPIQPEQKSRNDTAAESPGVTKGPGRFEVARDHEAASRNPAENESRHK